MADNRSNNVASASITGISVAFFIIFAVTPRLTITDILCFFVTLSTCSTASSNALSISMKSLNDTSSVVLKTIFVKFSLGEVIIYFGIIQYLLGNV